MIANQPLIPFKVFIVDDSPIIIERLSLMLNELDYISMEGHATNICNALIDIQEKKPDAVLLDIYLKEDAPDLSGIDLLMVLRRSYPNMIIMMLTNHANSYYLNKCVELGANYFFDKSNDFDKITDTLKKIYESK